MVFSFSSVQNFNTEWVSLKKQLANKIELVERTSATEHEKTNNSVEYIRFAGEISVQGSSCSKDSNSGLAR